VSHNFFSRIVDMAPTDYSTRNETESTIDQVSDSAREAGRRAVSLTEDIAETIRERPYTALAVAAGLAFAVGALWKLGHQRPHGSIESLLGKIPELPSRDSIRESIRDNIVPSRWR
jgi:hypothetical protein